MGPIRDGRQGDFTRTYIMKPVQRLNPHVTKERLDLEEGCDNALLKQKSEGSERFRRLRPLPSLALPLV